MLLNLLRSGDRLTIVIGFFASVFIVFCSMPLHEYAHALVATKLGDNTPRLQGRLTINPLAHIDWLGALMILLLGFGYAKPVEVNVLKLKKPKRDMLLIAAAGPFTNLIMANVFMLLRYIAIIIADRNGSSVVLDVCISFLYFATYINVIQVVFNLLPIPPLDGSRVVSFFIPNKYYFKIMQYERILMIAIFALIFFGVLDVPLSFLYGVLMKAITFITSLPFRAFI